MKKIRQGLARLLSGPHGMLWGSVLSVILTILTASALLLIMGKNPLIAFSSFLQGCGFIPKARYGGGGGMLGDLTSFLSYLTPMLLASLAFIAAFKTGLFNIGISGQMLLSGFLATVFVAYNKQLPDGLSRLLVILVGIVAGGLLGALIGYLKYRFNIHEVVSTIMINYIISYLTGFFINNSYVDMITRTSRACPPGARLVLPKVVIDGVNCVAPMGLIIAALAVVLVWFLFSRTTFGFELRAVGENMHCARYFGVNVKRSVVAAMGISGMLAGLAGVTYYLGYTNTIIPNTLSAMGYDSISVALLGGASPLGAVLAAVIVSIFHQGSNYMSSTVGVSREIASLITGILLLYASCVTYVRAICDRFLQRETHGDEAKRPEEVKAS